MPPPDDTIAVELPQSPHASSHAEPSVIGPSRKDFARIRNDKWSSPPCSVTPEREALRDLKTAWNKDTRKIPDYEDYRSKLPMLLVDVHNFEIYRSPISGEEERRCEFVSLNNVPKPTDFYMDGLISVGDAKHYVEMIHFQDIVIEGFGDRESPSVKIWLKSKEGRKDKDYDVWYQLKTPAANYKRFHDPFLWVAQLARHVIEYTEDKDLAHSIGLLSFRSDFHDWIMKRFSWNEDFRRWHAQFGHEVDFRRAVNAYIEFIARHVPDHVRRQPLWGECMVNSNTNIKKQIPNEGFTIITPNVFKCFKNTYFNDHLRECKPAPQIKAQQEDMNRRPGFLEICFDAISSVVPRCQKYGGASAVEIGDVVAIKPNEQDMRKWTRSNQVWLAYVQGVTRLDKKLQQLSILWIYRPYDTNIYNTEYPIKNELFLSDHCNCEEIRDVLSSDIKGKYDVVWSPTASLPVDQYFIRQTYVRAPYSPETLGTIPSAFKSVRPSHKTCKHKQGNVAHTDRYRRGDTVYMDREIEGDKTLDPIIITEGFNPTTGLVGIQKPLRLGRDCADLATNMNRINIERNELVLTNKTEYVAAAVIKHDRKCSIRFVPKDSLLQDVIPFPYSRGGAGDFWFVSMCLDTFHGLEQLSFLSEAPDCLLERNELKLTGPKLRGLSLFSGGGSLDRGLEDGGAVEFHTAVDFSAEAIHTQKANVKNPSTVRLYCGSVDDHLKIVLSGKKSPYCPRIGDVDLIAAGSPCPGFSSLQQDRYSELSKRNASHITTFCSYVDVYRPQYGVLENVVSIGDELEGRQGQNVLAQLVGSLVCLGYQVNVFIMDAWNYGSAQQRSRAIVTIAAPGLTPIMQPWHTHRTKIAPTKDSLGPLPTGERYGLRAVYTTPFAHVSAAEIAGDLPRMEGSVQSCILFPDHRLSRLSTWKQRAIFGCIPPGQGYKEAHKAGLIPPELEVTKQEIGKAYRRIKADGLIPTRTTSISVVDARNGASGHWSEDRPIGMLEARRAQGYPDDELVIGSLTQQIKIIGNGVDRWVSFALGLALRRVVDSDSASGKILSPSSLLRSNINSPLNKLKDSVNKGSDDFVARPRVRPKPKPKPKPAPSATASKRRWQEEADEDERRDSMELSDDESRKFKKQKTDNSPQIRSDVENSSPSSPYQDDLHVSIEDILITEQTLRTRHRDRSARRTQLSGRAAHVGTRHRRGNEGENDDWDELYDID